MQYETERLLLKTIGTDEAYLYQQYLIENKDFLSEWEPKREESYYSIENLKNVIEHQNNEMQAGRSLRFYLLLKNKEDIIGTIAISNIVYESFKSGYLGYKLCDREKNKGLMTEAIKKVVDIAFHEKGLHRIEANVLPRNERSKKVLKKAGFEYEGASKKYLRINGIWEDHEHYVILNHEME